MKEKKFELISIYLLLISFVIIPLFHEELFPYSRMNLFSDAPKQYTEYIVWDPKGNVQSNYAFGLWRTYHGVSLRYHYGMEPPKSINIYDRIETEEQVTEQIQKSLKIHPHIPYLKVTQHVYGPITNKRLGIIKKQTWKIQNPHQS